MAPERPNAGGRPALDQSVHDDQTSDTLALAADVSDREPDLDADPEPDLDAAQQESARSAHGDGPGGWWPAPRRLRVLLEDREITPTGFALLHYVGAANGDREGCVATKESLGALLGVSKRTIERVLPRLRELELVTYKVKQGQRDPFRLRLGRAALGAQAPTPPPPRAATVVADVTSATAPSPNGRERASVAASTSDSTSASRARAETKNEKKLPPYPPRGERGRRSSEERRMSRFGAKLPLDLAAVWQELDEGTRSTIVEAHALSTGLRFARGSHGGTWLVDPLGTDPRPAGTDTRLLPPDFEGHASQERFLRAFLERA